MRKTAFTAILFAMFLSAFSISPANAATLPKVLSTNTKLASQTNTVLKTVAATKTAAPSAQQKLAAEVPDPTITVQSGDTLIALAATSQTSYQRLFDANASLSDPNVINPGQQLTVPKGNEQLPDRISALPQATQQNVAAAANTYTSSKAATVSYPAVTGNDAKAFVYSHESGNNPNSTNPSGCYGLGQDCNGRVQAQCGADYACQDAYFTNYATSRYGGWDQAAAFWQTHGWW